MSEVITPIEALTKVFSNTVNNFYKEGVSVVLSDTPDTASCDGDLITLPKHLLETFYEQNLPKFTVLYHELGHALYSEELSMLINKWKNLNTTHAGFMYNDKYFHLLNWIEDYYIEDKILKDYPYLQDIVGCLKRLTLPYDINEIDKAFNHWYIKGYATPTLPPLEALQFSTYIRELLSLRSGVGFGRGPISLLSNRSKETKFIKMIIEFFNWCVAKKILPDNQALPKLSNPNNYIDKQQGLPLQPNDASQNNSSQDGTSQDSNTGGSYSDHTHLVGVMEVIPQYDTKETKIFNQAVVEENKRIKEYINNQNKVDSKINSLDGLFNNTYSDSPIIHNKVIVPNFFNPNRLADMVLFKQPNKSYHNVSIYRDISGSTTGKLFTLIDKICQYLDKMIPIDYHFYLYSSGNISILETKYIPWDIRPDEPEEYSEDPVFQQLGGGTNSGAIADVITEQLDDKWLNIIITDGDLNDLMSRDNIEPLLENVFAISVGSSSELQDVDHILIQDELQIENIADAINKWKGVY